MERVICLALESGEARTDESTQERRTVLRHCIESGPDGRRAYVEARLALRGVQNQPARVDGNDLNLTAYASRSSCSKSSRANSPSSASQSLDAWSSSISSCLVSSENIILSSNFPMALVSLHSESRIGHQLQVLQSPGCVLPSLTRCCLDLRLCASGILEEN